MGFFFFILYFCSLKAHGFNNWVHESFSQTKHPNNLINSVVHGRTNYYTSVSSISTVSDFTISPKNHDKVTLNPSLFHEYLENKESTYESVENKKFSSSFCYSRLLTTPFSSLWSSIVASFSLTSITEIGDRTFFLAAILATHDSKCIVFLGSLTALILQTLFSIIVGRILHAIPTQVKMNPLFSLPLDDYAAALLLFFFGVVHLKEAFFVKKQRSPRIQKDSVDSNNSSEFRNQSNPIDDSTGSRNQKNAIIDISTGSSIESLSRNSLLHNVSRLNENDNSVSFEDVPYVELPSCNEKRDCSGITKCAKRERLATTQLDISAQQREEANSGLLVIEVPPITVYSRLKKVFWTIFAAEFGDKSMTSTIALATVQNPYGVFFGTVLAHSGITLLAVMAGSILGNLISDRLANGIGGVLFLTFAVLTTLEGLARQGIHAWWILVDNLAGFFLTSFLAIGGQLDKFFSA